jgi:uncharacterized protein YkwD
VGYFDARAPAGVGENLSVGFPSAPHYAVGAWLNSASHRRVLLDPSWRELGLARGSARDFLGPPASALWVAQFGWRH